MTKPVRIQRKRTSGFSMQQESRRINGLECVYVGRPTKYGNPYIPNEICFCPMRKEKILCGSQAHCVDLFEELVCWQMKEHLLTAEYISDISGKNLACFCPLDQPCHADVLLIIANAEQRNE